ncbi:MAG: acyltransferase family protein [Oscillospiraceae bacterium]|nr:acyltransferase family protein [Oscillospiraceae bacterium]
MKQQRNGLIDFYRFIFALIIVIHHAMWLDGRYVGDIENKVFFRGGYSAVEFFFILSGFLLSKKAYDNQMDDRIGEKTWNEIFKRIKTMYPAFIIAYVIAFSLKYYFNGGNLFGMISSSVGELTLLLGAGFSFGDVIIGPIWYFSDLLISILLLFPLMKKYKKTFSTIIAPIIVILGYGYLAMSFKHLAITIDQLGIICGGILRGCCGVALGNVIFYLSLKDRIDFTKFGKIVLKLFEITCFILVIFFMNKHSGDYFDFIEIMLFAIIILLAFKYDYNNKIFNNKITSVLGEYSAILYVVHYSLIQIPKRIWPETWEMEYVMWIVMTNVVSVIVFLFIKFVFPKIHKAIKRLLVLDVDTK